LAEATYFVTWRLDRAQDPLTPPERFEEQAGLRHFDGKRYRLLAYVVMNDHAHAIVRPRASAAPEKIVHSWKSYTAHRLSGLGRHPPIWQADYFDRVIRSNEELLEKTRYILDNPVKRWPSVTKYAWVSIRQ
jgi:REP element-mobilizing transposase RayT